MNLKMLLFLIFALIVVSGFIAYLGDQIGMKIGKKRLSIFGIRPKYTSIIVTILTGIVIATTSVSILMLASEDVRMAVFDVQALIYQKARLSQDVLDKNAELKEKKDQLANKEHELDKKDSILKEKEIEIAETTFQLEEIRNEKEQLSVGLSEIEESLNQAKKEYELLAEENQTLEQNKLELAGRIQLLEEQKNSLEREKENLTYDVASLNQELDQLEEDTKKLMVWASLKLWDKDIGLEKYQNQDIVYDRGDSVYLESLKTIPNVSREEAFQAVDDFVDRASKYVQKHGLKVNVQGRSIIIEEDELIKLAEDLQDPEHHKLLVGVYAKKNTLADELLDARLQWEKNYIVFNENEVIYSKEIDSNLDSAELKKDIPKLILEKVNHLALSKGIIPDADGKVGTMDFKDFYDLIEKIKSYTGKVKVTVEAAQDIWREEILSTENIRFNVEPVGE